MKSSKMYCRSKFKSSKASKKTKSIEAHLNHQAKGQIVTIFSSLVVQVTDLLGVGPKRRVAESKIQTSSVSNVDFPSWRPQGALRCAFCSVQRRHTAREACESHLVIVVIVAVARLVPTSFASAYRVAYLSAIRNAQVYLACNNQRADPRFSKHSSHLEHDPPAPAR